MGQSIPVRFEELKSSGALPSPTGVGMKILEITRTDDYSVDEMADAIMSDPSLTGRILQLANNASVAGSESVTTVTGAIMRLGSSTVRTLALAFSLVSDREAGACRPFDYERYWSLSLARGVGAQVLADHTGVAKPEEAYICGLLCEVGMLALASVHSARYGEILNSTAGASFDRLREAEFDAFDIDHATVAECMLADWGLPSAFAEAIGGFSRQRRIGESSAPVESTGDLLRLADTIGSALLLGETSPVRKLREVGEQLERTRRALGMEEAQFSALCDRVARQWRSWGESLEIETSEVSYHQITAEIARSRSEQPDGATGTSRRGGVVSVSAPTLAVDTANEGQRISVLAVDDDPVSLRLLTRQMRNESFEVSMARSGRAGLRKALKEKPDIVVIDHEMPDQNGLEVVEALRRSAVGSSMYILLVTGNDSDELLIKAFDAGVDDFVPKPIRPRLLSARIKAGVRIANLSRKIERDHNTILDQLAELNRLNRRFRTASLTDPLTGLPNRRHCMDRLDAEWKAFARNEAPFTVIMLDIDRFKAVNDSYGHDVGDDVLQATSRAIVGALRGEDEAFRLGGEEFMVLCRTAHENDGAVVAERIRQAVESNVVEASGFELAVTVSLGVAGVHAGVESLMALLKAADEAVYQAKNAGRNRLQLAGAPAPTPEESMRTRRSA
ncbi:MAG: diguanylate cyclase [Planctomycetota bacterium]|nr:diguanylate cyclase [Planctomycetota bacterium]MEC8513121.1 diguanylate cyclase [Planctomycetota bacterium]